MKSRQFITIIAVLVVWFIYLWYKINKAQDYLANIDNNVATIDERIVWDIQPKVESLYDRIIYNN